MQAGRPDAKSETENAFSRVEPGSLGSRFVAAKMLI
jgi:hypothetical protein